MSLLIVGLDNTIVNIAVPAIRSDLDASLAGVQWTIDAYSLVLASLLLMAGSTADRIGRRRTFQTGLAVFVIGSLLCGLAPSLGWLVAFRVLQAIGGSMLNPVAMSIITNVFTDRRERAQAIGVWAGVVGISMALGPVVGGLLVESVGWRTIFWLNVPIGVAAIILTALFVPESRAPRPRRVDLPGQVIVLALMASATYAIIETSIVAGVVAVVALAALLIVEPRRHEPLVDLKLFRSPPFAGATLIAVAAFSSLAGFLLLNTIYLQEVRGYTPLHAGLLTLPIAAITVILGPLSGRLVGARGPRPSLLFGGVGIGLSGLLLTRLDEHTPLAWLLAAYVVFGIGFAMVNPPITVTAVSGLPTAQAGVAAAFASTSRQFGAALGVAVLGAVVAAGLHGAPLADGFVSASHAAWWIVAGCGVAVLCIGTLTTGRRVLERQPEAELVDA
ncbi:MFS transporter [Dactylosporangium fulvum]|uniref:MFS transporter n=2 Tax=Dactylosporangium fulvum TaxID=53359 RepID=A0ABY5VWX3_9ACTN|nr:MFS transporter [Dactylosporangium fulvum]UWP82237.1 MFS transporter [Dactylosporangium fulvum]